MPFTILERLFTTERFRQRTGRVGHAMPTLAERPAALTDGPFLATNMNGTFLVPKLSRNGTVRFAFSVVPLAEEIGLLTKLHVTISESMGSGRCTSLAEASSRLRAGSMEPRSMVLPEAWLPEICGPDFDVTQAAKLMAAQGYVSKVGEMQVLFAPLPPDKAFVASAPSLVGVYTRISDYLGLLLFHAGQALIPVTRGVDR